MIWLGLTGGIATGKSTVAEFLRKQGIPVICADRLAREAVQIGTPGLNQVALDFGPGVLSADGSLDRKALGQKVFGYPDRLLRLEGIIHPEVRRLQKEQRDMLEKAGTKLAVYDVPLLFEKNLEGDYAAVIVVASNPEIQLARLMKRDCLSEADAMKRIHSQLPIAEKVKRADFVIQNDGSLGHLEAEVSTVTQKILKHFKIEKLTQ